MFTVLIFNPHANFKQLSFMHNFSRERYVYTQLGRCSLISLRAEHPSEQCRYQSSAGTDDPLTGHKLQLLIHFGYVDMVPSRQAGVCSTCVQIQTATSPFESSMAELLQVHTFAQVNEVWRDAARTSSGTESHTFMCILVSAVHLINKLIFACKSPCRHNLKYSPKLQPTSSFSLGFFDHFKVTIVCLTLLWWLPRQVFDSDDLFLSG